ncbi:MAG: RIP metalloprotease RseP [Bacteroidales bacterium]|nr:RIP metalloprotease RseP [Bacteroidales bacterium]
MEAFWIKALQLIVALALLVTIHEFGHYFFARVFGIKVEKFYLFFNPWFSLFKYKPKPKKGEPKLDKHGNPKATWRDTEYGIGWVPLGGYCKIAGMIDESMDKEQMAKDPEPWEFRSKPAWQRLFVMVGGVLFNLLLAFVIYAGIAFYWGEKTIEFRDASLGYDYVESAHKAGFQDGDIPLTADGRELSMQDRQVLMRMAEAKQITVQRPGVGEVTIDLPEDFIMQLNNDKGFFSLRVPVVVKDIQKGMPAAEAGIQAGDSIIAVGGVSAPDYVNFTAQLEAHKGEPTTVTAMRDGVEQEFNLTPTENGKIGIALTPVTDIYPVTEVKYNLLEAMPKGVEIGTNTLVMYVGSLKHLFTKEGATSIGGFGAIGNMFPERWNWLSFWEITAFLSVILAFMNIIPIPALDGGHVMFVLWEMVTRRKPSEKFLEYAQMCGMAFLLVLLVYANGLDLIRSIF